MCLTRQLAEGQAGMRREQCGQEADPCQINVLHYVPLNKLSQQHLMKDVFLPPSSIHAPIQNTSYCSDVTLLRHCLWHAQLITNIFIFLTHFYIGFCVFLLIDNLLFCFFASLISLCCARFLYFLCVPVCVCVYMCVWHVLAFLWACSPACVLTRPFERASTMLLCVYECVCVRERGCCPYRCCHGSADSALIVSRIISQQHAPSWDKSCHIPSLSEHIMGFYLQTSLSYSEFSSAALHNIGSKKITNEKPEKTGPKIWLKIQHGVDFIPQR